MDIRRLSSESGFPITLDDLKQDLRVDDGDEDGTLERMMQFAAGVIERRSAYVLIPGTFRATLDTLPYCSPVEIFRSPYRALTAISYMSAKNIWTDLDVDDFQVTEIERGFRFEAFSGVFADLRPCVYPSRAGVRVDFSAGFDTATEAQSESDGEQRPIDPTVRGVFIAFVGHIYENRELFAADKLSEIESTAGGLLNSIRWFW